MESAIGWTLWSALVPLSALVAARVLPSLRPRRRRPVFFVAAFVFFAAFGVAAVLVAQHSIDSGAFRVSSRKFGDFDYRAAHRPLEFWTAIAVSYCVGAYLVGLGIASACLCLRKSSRSDQS